MHQLSIPDPSSAHDQVAHDLMERKAVGIATYGRLLNRDSPEDMLQMAYEECLDMACYLKTEMLKRQGIEPIVSISDDSILTWKEFFNLMRDKLIPDYLTAHGGVSSHFSMNELKDWMSSHPDQYPYQDRNKRMSTAITRLIRQEYFYRPSRYTLAATGKYVTHLANLRREEHECISQPEGEDHSSCALGLS